MATQVLNGIAVEVSGEGDPVLCIHGLGGSSNTWTPVLAGFDGFKVIRVDLPGSARSDVLASGLGIQGFVDAVVDVLQQLNVHSAHVAAHSMGTIVAQHLAAQHPHRVNSLALFGPLVCPPDAGRSGIRARARLAREGVTGMQQIADTIVAGATSRETKVAHPAVLALVRESVMRQPAEGYAQSCEALADAESAPLEEIVVPTLLVTGDQDSVAPEAAVNAMALRLKHAADVIVLHGCGHWTTFEKPEECVEILQRFYRSVN